MQESSHASADKQTRAFNPVLDFTVACLEAQLKAWQAYQVEGARFVAKRLHANLEYVRALGHCCDTRSLGECHKAWLSDSQKDYAEECARITATTFAIGFGDLAGLGWLFGQRTPKHSPQVQADPEPQPGSAPRSRSGLAAAA